MVLRPFPQALHVGIDICRMARFEPLTKPGKLRPLLGRLFTRREHAYFVSRFKVAETKTWVPEQEQQVIQYIAGRWAAKEACIKAVKPQKVTLRQIEIWPDQHAGTYAIILDRADDKPYLEEHSGSREANIGEAASDVPSHENVNGQVARVSISHEDIYACAVAMAVPGLLSGDVGGEATARAEVGSTS